MTFTSFEYLLFLPCVFILYWLVCGRSKTLQNLVLLVANITFYAMIDWRFLVLLAISVISTHISGNLLNNNKLRGG